MASENFKSQESVFRFFVDYVSNRNVDLITKTEWESLYFYCAARSCFPEKNLVALETADLYKIGEVLNLDFSKVTWLLKKCYRFESKEIKEMTFKELVESSSILKPICDNDFVKFGIVNSLVQFRVEELLNMAGVFSDTSFKKNIFSVPPSQFLRLIEAEDQTLITKLRLKADDFVKKVAKRAGISDSSKIKEMQNLINATAAKSAAKTAVDVIGAVSSVAGIPSNACAKIAIETLNNVNVFKYVKQA